MRNNKASRASLAALVAAMLSGAAVHPAYAQGPNPLITGKSITVPASGVRQSVGSLPMNMILTPDGKYAISTDMGFRQSLWCISTATGKGVSHLDFPRQATGTNPDGSLIFNSNGLYYGLAAAANPGGGSTVYAAQGDNSSIAVINVSPSGMLTQTRTITGISGDFIAGLALDKQGHLYAAVNEVYTQGGAVDPTVFSKPGALAIFDAATGTMLGRFAFTNLGLASAAAATPNFPLSVAALADGSKVYVSTQRGLSGPRDGAVYVINTTNPAMPTLAATLPTGAHPDGLLLNKAQTTLYVSNAHSDTVSAVRVADNSLAGTLLLRPTGASTLPGATPTGLALSPDERTLYVALGDMNAVAVCDPQALTVKGYIPAGWYPTAVAVSPSGTRLLVANAKGTQTRNPNKIKQGPDGSEGTYILNIIEGNVVTLPLPNAALLASQTTQVLANNKITATTATPPNPLAGINLQAGGIKHVVYIVKENRTYDQVLGDLPQGNGDPSLTLFGDGGKPGTRVTPNFHTLASRFVLLDNFYDCGEASGDGWPWTANSFATEYIIKDLPYNYSGRGRNYDFEGSNNMYLTGGFPALDPDNRPLSLAFPTGAPPIADVGEGPNGHIWDDVLANVQLAGTGLTKKYRNYGFFYSLELPVAGGTPPPANVFPDNYPASAGIQPPGHDLAGVSDYDYREFDLTFPDSDAPAIDGVAANWKILRYSNYTPAQVALGKIPATSRFQEFQKEFKEMLAADPTGNSVPAFLTVRFMNDHTDGTTPGDPSPRAHVADNDYAIGQFVDLVSHSPIWSSTAIFVIEDDAQDGQDHVDAHRSNCFVISPYIHANSVDHTFYNTDSVLKTMEQLMGIPPLSQYDATANTILDFDNSPTNGAPYTAILPDQKFVAELNPVLSSLKPGTEAYHLARLAARMDFRHPDSANPALLNEMIWKSVRGMKSRVPAPRHSVTPTKTAGAPAPQKDND